MRAAEVVPASLGSGRGNTNSEPVLEPGGVKDATGGFSTVSEPEEKEVSKCGLSSADAAVRRAEFHTALGIMQELMQKYKIAEKQFEEFTKKLKDIDDIANPPPQP